MRILWITNILFPDVCLALNKAVPVGGGWMYSTAKYLINSEEKINLAVVSLYDGDIVKEFLINNITYILVPGRQNITYYNEALEQHYKQIVAKFKPDITHIHGSEYPHTLAYLKSCGNHNVILSIQGLVHIISNYFFGGIAKKDILKNITLRDILRNDTLLKQQSNFEKRGLMEVQALQLTKYIIGRTSWDKAHTWAINPNAKYYHCNENMRSVFYEKKWSYEACNKHTIFLSQSYYPIKGLHQLIKALPYIIREYPDVKVMVTGDSFEKKPLYRSGYGSYILALMKKLNVKRYFKFLGSLSEEQMCNQMLSANVFVCPSAIENSSNSIAEAQLVGTPCIASYVGGTMDMVSHDFSGLLYRFEETEMLANQICHVFSNPEYARILSENERQVALKRHDRENNSINLLRIYHEICKE